MLIRFRVYKCLPDSEFQDCLYEIMLQLGLDIRLMIEANRRDNANPFYSNMALIEKIREMLLKKNGNIISNGVVTTGASVYEKDTYYLISGYIKKG